MYGQEIKCFVEANIPILQQFYVTY